MARRWLTASVFRRGSLRSFSSVAAEAAVEPVQTFEEALGEGPLLVRDYIRQALYHPKFGYFSARPDVVGTLDEPFQFKELKGWRYAYRSRVSELYEQSDVSWFTPVELFQPWYGYAIAEYMLQTMNTQHPLQVYEIGGGTGTCASNVLEYIKAKQVETYETMRYTSVEVSEGLAKKQLHRVRDIEGHGDKFRVEHRHASDKSAWGEPDESPCYVVMLEVLDNMPHDLLYRSNFSAPWMETCVHYVPSDSKLVEDHRPVQDPLITRCLEVLTKERSNDYAFVKKIARSVRTAFTKVIPSSERLWIPTGCMELLEVLHYARPNMVMLASDFSILPDVKVPGYGAPLVSSKSGGVTTDYSSYLEAKGNADIFFPTDFYKLQLLDNECALSQSGGKIPPNKHGIYRGSAIMSLSNFMSRFAYVNQAKTKSGFNPLLDEYSNTQVYLSAPVIRE